jgi:adenylate cyclase
MFTDMVGYTALGQRDETLSLALVGEQRKLLRPIFQRHNGREVKTIGDAFLVEFPSALDAVRCAYDIQRATREFNVSLPSEKRVHLRVGVHLGDVVESQGDISGDAVNVASRIESLADDGGVCLTQQVYDHVKGKFELPLMSLGTKSLKNVGAPIEVYKMAMPWEEKTVSSTQFDTRRIAVLPFVNMSPDSNDEYFAEGMTEELITTMSRVQGLQVIARTSVTNYKGGGTKLSTIGSDLRVGTVLEGSVRKAGNRVRVTAQLIDVPTESHLWSERYDRELDDIFKIQDDIAGKIAEALRVRLATPRERPQERVENIEAYTMYMKGRFLWNKRSKEGVLEAIKSFEEATKIDPTSAKAYTGLADAYSIAATYDFMDRTEGYSKGREAVTRALELDEGLPEAHASMGLILLGDLRYHEAQRELERAIELSPSYASAHHWYSLCLIELGNLNKAIDEITKAREIDPLSPVITGVLAQEIASTGRVDEALVLLDKLLEREPAYAGGYLMRSWYFALKGMKERAFAEFETFHKLSPDEEERKIGMAVFHAWFGETGEALRLIQEVLQETHGAPKDPFLVAECYAVLGKRDECFSWVDRAIEMKSFSVWFLRYGPSYDKVKDDPRFPEIFRRLGLPY